MENKTETFKTEIIKAEIAADDNLKPLIKEFLENLQSTHYDTDFYEDLETELGTYWDNCMYKRTPLAVQNDILQELLDHYVTIHELTIPAFTGSQKYQINASKKILVPVKRFLENQEHDTDLYSDLGRYLMIQESLHDVDLDQMYNSILNALEDEGILTACD